MSVMPSPRHASNILLKVILAVLPLCFTHRVHAQQSDLIIPTTAATPVIDGTMQPGEWRDAAAVSLTNEVEPGQNVAAPVDTRVHLMGDDENFYVAFVAYDPEPEKIRAFYRERDDLGASDLVGVVLDTFNDERRAFEFFVNPLGVQMDLVLDAIAGGEDSSWNAIWDSAGTIDDDGYVVEMRIPLNQLRFRGDVDRQVWGIDLLRIYPRDVRHTISSNLRDYSVSCLPCQFEDAVGFAGVEQSLNLQITPELTASVSENRGRDSGSSWERNDSADAGLDVRWGIGSNLYFNATVNPDFSQVEADVAQLAVNNTFSLFYPERREFFLDGADYFNTPSNLVYTRNIASPDYGMKLTGKEGRNTYALLFADDAATNFLIPGNQGSSIASLASEDSRNFVLRYRFDLGRNSALGAISTARRGDDYMNNVLGVDGSFQVTDSDSLSFQMLNSSSEYPDGIRQEFGQAADIGDNAYILDYDHSGENWDWYLRYFDFGADFRADMGFIGKVDYRQPVIGLGYLWRPGPDAVFNRIRLSGDWDKTWDQNGLELEEEGEAYLRLWGPMQSFLMAGYLKRKRYYNGRYFDEWGSLWVAELQPRPGLELALVVNDGDVVDFANTRLGHSRTYSPEATLQIGRNLQLGAQYDYQVFDVDGGQLYETHLTDFRATWHFNGNSFLRSIVQYSDTRRDPSLYVQAVDRRSRDLTTQLLYSYRVNAATRFFVGYSDTGLDNDDLAGLRTTNRTVFAKFRYAWRN